MIFSKKIEKKKFFFQNFDFLALPSSASRPARNMMRVLKMFSWLWRIQKMKNQVPYMTRTCQNRIAKIDENHKKSHF